MTQANATATSPDQGAPTGPDIQTADLSALLADQGLTLISDPHGPQAEPAPGQTGNAPAATDHYVAAVPALGVIEVKGDDAPGFLQGQLTNDVEGLAPNQCQWAGLCSPKGRLLASFLVVRSAPDCYYLVTNRDLAAPISKRLSMYVLRAKVKVADQSAQTVAIGLHGDAAVEATATLDITALKPMMAQVAGSAPVQLAVGLPPVPVNGNDVPRCLLLVHSEQFGAAWQVLSAQLPVRPSAWWRSSDIVSGLAHVVPAIQEAFVPQMVNFELIGGVDFEKGCYTGQEVVARSQYLGKMKRRMFVAGTASQPMPGDDVTDENERSVGTVVASAPGIAVQADHETVILFESRVDAGQQVRINGAPIAVLSLPYDIPEPTPFVRPV